MENYDKIRAALAEDDPVSSRDLRADLTRASALSVSRILGRFLMVPVTTASITLSGYIALGPHAGSDAVRHLLSMSGCETASLLGLAPARLGEIGYHSRFDPDGDGVSCVGYAMTAASVAWPQHTQAQLSPDALLSYRRGIH